MATIIFYEKTGCVNNTKQKKILEMAGHKVEAINLVTYPWTEEELLSFFSGMEVKDWFNKNAPSVTKGNVDPAKFDGESAISTMLNDHLLIRRPLMVIGDHKLIGFDKEKLESLIGLGEKETEEMQDLLSQDLSICPQKSKKCD